MENFAVSSAGLPRSITPMEIDNLRGKIFQIEQVMLRHPQVELPLFHHFAPGLYARELHIPKGVTLTGKIHKYVCLSIMPKGDMSVLINGAIVRVTSPLINVAPAGTKRIAYAHEDSIWVTVHATTQTDIATLEDDLVCDTEQQYIDFVRLIECHS
jgi:hypothetical protein